MLLARLNLILKHVMTGVLLETQVAKPEGSEHSLNANSSFRFFFATFLHPLYCILHFVEFDLF